MGFLDKESGQLYGLVPLQSHKAENRYQGGYVHKCVHLLKNAGSFKVPHLGFHDTLGYGVAENVFAVRYRTDCRCLDEWRVLFESLRLHDGEDNSCPCSCKRIIDCLGAG